MWWKTDERWTNPSSFWIVLGILVKDVMNDEKTSINSSSPYPWLMISLKGVGKISNIFLLASTPHQKLREMKNAMERHGYKISLPFPIAFAPG
jgi:hypothetical protein